MKKAQTPKARVEFCLSEAGTTFQEIDRDKIRQARDAFVSAFFDGKMPDKAYLLSAHLTGDFKDDQAMEKYQQQWPAEFYVFGIPDDRLGYDRAAEPFGYTCSGPYPDFTKAFEDVFVVHHNMKWAMVFDHDREIGPKFVFSKKA